jgi:DNA-binding response OmpR family regulator
MSQAVPRVIVVDDHPESRHTTASVLAVHGHACAEAGNAEQALALCLGERFACMLLDEVLGEDSGLALAARLRALPQARPARILMMSGLAPEFFEDARREGLIDGYLEKPVGMAELLAAVEPALRAGPAHVASG